MAFGASGVMMWRYFSSPGVGQLHCCDGTIHATHMTDIYNNKFTGTIENQGWNLRFMQDNATVHASRIAKEVLKRLNIINIQWLARNPNFNPIKNLQAVLKRQLVDNCDSEPKTNNELQDRIQQEWNRITSDECQKLPRSCSKTIAALKLKVPAATSSSSSSSNQ